MARKTKKKKPQAIGFDPIACLKTLPNEFWLEVPTWNDRFRSAYLQAYDSVDVRKKDTFGERIISERVPKVPEAAEDFPAYRDFWSKYVDFADENRYEVDYFPYGKESTPKHDWVVYTLGEFSFRLECTSHGFQVHHPAVEGFSSVRDWTWRYNGELPLLEGENHNDARCRFRKLLEKSEKSVGITWNRLRKNARRAEGVESSAKSQKALAAKVKTVAIAQAKMDTLLYVQNLIKDLQQYHGEVEQGTITRARVREIFDNTNGLTAQNAKLKKAMGVR